MAYFSRSTFDFLRDLAENNDRDWFAANRGRYEAHVKEPAQRFILAIGEDLDQLTPPCGSASGRRLTLPDPQRRPLLQGQAPVQDPYGDPAPP